MKIIAIGDIHGRNIWKKIVDKTDADKIVFIGDYFDSFDIKGEEQINNFKDIITYKKTYPNKVILLLGNHDFHYLDVGERYSGFQNGMQYYIASEIKQAIKENLLQICYITGNLIFVHAGVTKTWCVNNNIDLVNIEQSINDTFTYKPNAFKFTPGKNQSVYGDDVCQSPIWVRPQSLLIDKIDNYTQIVGHTQQNKLTQIGEAVFIDTLGTSGEYLQITDGKMEAKKNI